MLYSSLFRCKWLFVSLLLCVTAAAARVPVVGILAQPYHGSTNGEYYDYIAASYVKWCEAGGALAIPVPYNASDMAVYDAVLSRIDGLLLPGGAAPLSRGVTMLLDRVRHLQAAGRYLPVWGTCLGMEFMVQYMGATLESGFEASNVSWPLEQVQRYELYVDEQVYKAVTEHNITLNNHFQGIRPDTFQRDPVLPRYWRMTSMNYDGRGVPFVSTLEPINATAWPWYGVQYHPEKNAFEYGIVMSESKNDAVAMENEPSKDYYYYYFYEAINHSTVAVQFSLQMAQFWIGLVRKASLQRQEAGEIMTPLCDAVYCFKPMYMYPVKAGRAFEQMHLIPNDDYYVKGRLARQQQQAYVSTSRQRKQRRRNTVNMPRRTNFASIMKNAETAMTMGNTQRNNRKVTRQGLRRKKV